jgi:PhnB protein
MTNANTYLNFQGNTEAAMTYYKSVLGGEFTAFQRFRDMVGGDKMPAEDQGKMMHITLQVNKDFAIMATDALESMEQKVIFGNNFYICIQAESEKEVDKLFDGLSTGGKVEMPVNKTFWGAYCGMTADKFGVQWMINYTYPA